MEHGMRYRVAACAAFVLLGSGGCAIVDDSAMRLVSSKRDATLLINGQLLAGFVMLAPDRTGTVEFDAARGNITKCAGALRFTASQSGTIALQCSDASAPVLNFSLLRDARGYAYGQADAGPVSLVFGMPAADARAYLRVPAGRKLVVNTEEETLELQ